MNWFMAMHGWQIWAFSFGIAFLITGLVFLSTKKGHVRSKQYQRLSGLSLQTKRCKTRDNQPNCPFLQKGKCGSLSNEVLQELETKKTEQSQTGEQNGHEDKGLK